MTYNYILFDIGNTSASYGSYYGGRMSRTGSCKYSEIPKIVKKCTKNGSNIKNIVVISSVVPKISSKLKKSLRAENRALWIVGKDLKVPVRHKYKNSNKLGIDRLVNLYGASRIYKAPLLMIDFGTAITFDYLSAKNVFEGGMIVPGPEISFQALLERAAKIPNNLRLPEKSGSFLGRDTYDCIRSGTLEGYGALTDGLITRFRKRYGKNLQVIATGGFAKNVSRHTTQLKTVDRDHNLKSLLLLAKNRLKSKGLRV